YLEQRQVGRAAREVAVRGLQQTGDERAAQERRRLVEGVREPHGGLARAVGGSVQVVHLLGDEWERDGLDEPRRRERVRDAAPRALLARVSAARRRQRQDRRHLVEAVDARDLLDEAPLVDEVGAPRRRRDVEAAFGVGDLAADALEDLALPLGRVLDAD